MQGVSSRPSNSAETTTTDLCVMRKEGERGNEKGELYLKKETFFLFFWSLLGSWDRKSNKL